MANLIITIISIALIAIVALVSIYYGGAAYSSYQAKAKATEIVTKMRQVKAAALLWQANNFRNYPITDPMGQVASCEADNNGVMECWSNNLTYNNIYLNGMEAPSYTGLSAATRGAAGEIDIGLSYGSYGIHKGDLENGFNSAFVKVQSMPSGWPNANPTWYVRWFIDTSNYATYHTSGSPTQTEAKLFMWSVCHEINKLIGYEKANGTYSNLPPDTAGNAMVMNNNNITGTSTPINLPYTPDGAANVCIALNSGATLNQLTFLLPIN